MKIIEEKLLNKVGEEAKVSPRLRINYNFHGSLLDKCHRFMNAMELGSVVPIHHHPTKEETFIVLRGGVKVSTYNDDGSVIESVILSHEDGLHGVDIKKGVWHNLESLQENSVIFECKEGPFVPHEVDGILEVPEK